MNTEAPATLLSQMSEQYLPVDRRVARAVPLSADKKMLARLDEYHDRAKADFVAGRSRQDTGLVADEFLQAAYRTRALVYKREFQLAFIMAEADEDGFYEQLGCNSMTDMACPDGPLPWTKSEILELVQVGRFMMDVGMGTAAFDEEMLAGGFVPPIEEFNENQALDVVSTQEASSVIGRISLKDMCPVVQAWSEERGTRKDYLRMIGLIICDREGWSRNPPESQVNLFE